MSGEHEWTRPVPPLEAPWYGIGFMQSLRRFFRKTFVFHGRASRGEYWWVFLATMMLYVAIGGLSGVYDDVAGSAAFEDPTFGNPLDIVGIVVQLILFVPNLSLSVRRLHDENLRGWWVILPTVLVIGAFGALIGIVVAGEWADGVDSRTTMGIAALTFFGMYLLAELSQIVLMVLPSRPQGARFDRPARIRVRSSGRFRRRLRARGTRVGRGL